MMIRNREELDVLKARKREEMALRLGEDFDSTAGGRMHILVCGVAGCQSAGSLAIYESLMDKIARNGLQSEIRVLNISEYVTP